MASDFHHWARYLERARDGYSRPIANNTRVHWAGEDAVAIQLHYTDVVTLHRDGTQQVSSGGWRTVTTSDRIRNYSNVSVISHPCRDGYTRWCIRAEYDPNDPHPLGPSNARAWARSRRTIPKPYHAPDPGPEPVDDGEGCIAGRLEEYEGGELSRVFDGLGDEPASWHHITSRYYSDGSGPYRAAHIAYMTGLAYGESPHNSQWGEDHDKHIEVPDGWTYKQCPHCKAFRELHRAWELAYEGPRWGRGAHLGYRQMCELLDQFGSREAWQEAYITEFREVRATNATITAWNERNLIPFYDGITVTSEGLVPLKAKRAHCRQLERQAIERRRQERVHARVRREQAKLQAKRDKQRKREREVKHMMANALIGSMIVELDNLRQESFV